MITVSNDRREVKGSIVALPFKYQGGYVIENGILAEINFIIHKVVTNDIEVEGKIQQSCETINIGSMKYTENNKSVNVLPSENGATHYLLLDNLITELTPSQL